MVLLLGLDYNRAALRAVKMAKSQLARNITVMHSLTFLCMFLGFTHGSGNVYLPAGNELATGGKLATEYFTYAAPPEDDQTVPLQSARQLAQVLSPPQQVVFIRTPETNLFTLTAKQLAVNNPLDIFVLHRQADADALAKQQAAIQQQATEKPSVHFVKYRTPADVTRALSALRSNYDRLPGNSINHAVEKAEVIHLNPQPTEPPVIFKIRPKDSTEYETHEQASELETAKLQALFREYLPPGKRR
ncbi:uncharacterized protein LOC108095710 [Drosophila ficusphila]|uniref:uncharacterized protein LOC108095710 n=1 Tax=Drosophila ficusphila TaxID=30025 RepID=UPI0007E87B68|nr:uncharacterized protein LOC108095710 [Drosophila ficusphila]